MQRQPYHVQEKKHNNGTTVSLVAPSTVYITEFCARRYFYNNRFSKTIMQPTKEALRQLLHASIATSSRERGSRCVSQFLPYEIFPRHILNPRETESSRINKSNECNIIPLRAVVSQEIGFEVCAGRSPRVPRIFKLDYLGSEGLVGGCFIRDVCAYAVPVLGHCVRTSARIFNLT